MLAVGVAAVALVLVSSAAAATWTAKDMGAAIRALHYPKPSLGMTCRGKTTYRCVATYRRHRHRVFYAQWQSMGGWLCAGAKPSTCKLLRHGFIPTADIGGSLAGAAQYARRAAT